MTSVEQLVRARLDAQSDYQELVDALDGAVETGFSGWDLDHEQGIRNIKQLKSAARGKKKKQKDEAATEEPDRVLPSYVLEMEETDLSEDADAIHIDPDTVEPEDCAWTEPGEEGNGVRMFSTAEPGSMPGAAVLIIRNLVTRALTGQPIDIPFVVSRCGHLGVSYNPRRFAAAIRRMDNPKCTVLIFPTGVIVTTGSCEQADASKATEETLRMLRRVKSYTGSRPYRSIQRKKITVHNMVGTTFVNFLVDLRKLKQRNSFVQYEPEEWRGATVYMRTVCPSFEKKNITVLVFSSGGLVITGALDTSEILRVYDTLFPFLLDCMIQSGLALEDRASEDRMRRAQTDLKRAREAGPNSQAMIALDAGKRDEMLRLMVEEKKGSLDLVPAEQKALALSAQAGVSAPTELANVDVDTRNMIALHTYNEAERRQIEIREKRAREKELIEQGRWDEVVPKRVKLIDPKEARHLDIQE